MIHVTYPDLMIDIETLGTTPGSIVLSLGATAFDISTGEIGPSFYQVLNKHEQVGYGATTDPDTLKWWDAQPAEARKVLMQAETEGVDIKPHVHDFSDWLLEHCYGDLAAAKRYGRLERVWAQGQDFDFPLYKHAIYSGYPRDMWAFHMQRDTRTAYDMADLLNGPVTVRDMVSREGTHHNAMDDTIHQAKCVIAAMQIIKEVRSA